MPRLTRTALCLAAATALGVPPAQAQEDPALRQRIDAGQRVATDKVVVARGHVDVGPRFLDGKWTLMIHDDSRKADGVASVWRHPERTVLQVAEAGRLNAPDDPAYAFLHAEPSAPVYVVPETQERDVVWVGWNAQDPKVMETLDRGATLTMMGVQGPGSLVVYLQSGSFSEPKVLWDSTARKPSPVWLDVNTHTHANWVFSKPGIYLVRFRITADLLDGTKVSDTRELRFAVGGATRADDAFAATWSGADPAAATATPRGERADVAGGDGSGPLLAALAAAALALGAGLAAIVVRGGRAKRRARSLGIRPLAAVEDEREAS
jgi:surface-anchored protein